MSAAASTSAALPWPVPRTRSGRIAAVAAAYVGLTLLFVLLGFPYDALAPRLAAAVETATGMPVSIGRLDVGFALLRPQLLLWDVAITPPGTAPLELDRVRVGPAFSTSWLRGRPAIAVALRRERARLDGTTRLGGPLDVEAEFAAVPLERLPAAWLQGLGLDGTASGRIDLHDEEGVATGDVQLELAGGSIALPNLPVALPFERVVVDAALGGEALATVRSLMLEGPMLAGSGSGTVGHAAVASAAPLAIELRLEAREPALRSLLAGQGVRLAEDGSASLRLGGTLASPILQPAPGAGRAAPGRPTR